MTTNNIFDKKIRGIDFKLAVSHPRLKFYAETFPEQEVLDFIDSLSEEDILLDLGSAEGRFSVYAAKKGIETWAIEPDRHNFAALKVNQEINSIHNLHIAKIAIGKSSGQSKLMSGQPYPGGHQKILQNCEGRQDLQFHFSEVQDVETITFDDLCQRH